MKYIVLAILIALGISAFAQEIDLVQQIESMEGINVSFSEAEYKGKKAIKVVPDAVQVEAKYVKLNAVEFKNGTIEVTVAGMRQKSAGQFARGFAGIAFRVNDDNSKFECFYIRPTNGRANDQLRRNHSVQYFSFPEYPWHRLREETPGKYETYTDLEEGAWTKFRIEVEGDKARLYVNGAEQPTMIVNDLKLGADVPGKIGLWVGPGTEAYFSDLVVTGNKF